MTAMTKPIVLAPTLSQKHSWDLLSVGALVWASLFGMATVALALVLH